MEHEPTETPNWDTKITCTCGERCSNWMEFYRHRGDAYRAEVGRLRVADTALRAILKARAELDDAHEVVGTSDEGTRVYTNLFVAFDEAVRAAAAALQEDA